MPKLRLRSAAPALLSLAVLLTLSACGFTEYPNSTFNHTTDFNTSIDALFSRLVFWGTIVFVVVEAALIFTIIRYRKRPGGAPAKQIHGNAALEITWTAIPAIILVLIAVPTVKTIFETQKPAPAGSLTVEVVGHQWWWEFRYPELGITTAGELVVPSGRTVSLEMTTADVLHSFWLPQFAGKRDVFPGRYNNLWFKAEVEGNFPAQCVEFCGVQHGRMAYRIVSVKPEAFDAWAANFNAPPKDFSADSTANPLVREGQRLFTAKGCGGCHAMYPALPLIGPNLHHVGSRSHIAAGTLENTDENLARWIKNPQEWKTGVLMPNLGLTDQEAAAIVAYLRANQ